MDRAISDTSHAFSKSEIITDAKYGAAGGVIGKGAEAVAEGLAGGGALKEIEKKLGYAKLGEARRVRLTGQAQALALSVARAGTVAERSAKAAEEFLQKTNESDKKSE